MSVRGIETHNGHIVFPEDTGVIVSEETTEMHKITEIQLRKLDKNIVVIYE